MEELNSYALQGSGQLLVTGLQELRRRARYPTYVLGAALSTLLVAVKLKTRLFVAVPS